MAKPLVSKASNVSDSTLQKHIRAISSLKTTLDSAQGEYRSALKAAKAEGVKTAMLIAALAAKRRDADDVTSDLRDYVRYLALLNMPVHQMDLFASAGAEFEEIEPAADDEHRQWQAHEDGVEAGARGNDQRTNPFEAGTFSHQAWMDGWMKGQESLLPKAGVKKASTRRNRNAAGFEH
jgi:predicted DNA-binding ribbon-helix-helix protein/ribosome modulation factor